MSDSRQTPPDDDQDEQAPARKTSMLEVLQGVLAGLFGVQSARNRERDFKRGDARDYIAVYVILVVALVLGVVVAVNLVLSAAGQG